MFIYYDPPTGTNDVILLPIPHPLYVLLISPFSLCLILPTLYFVIPDYFQPCLQHTRVSLNPYLLLQCPCKSLSGYLLQFSYPISIASGKLLMKRLKEIQAIALQSYMQNIIQFEAWITNNYFLNELAPIGHQFHQSSSLSFLLLFQIVTVYPFSTSIIPSQLMTRQHDQEKHSEVWLFSVLQFLPKSLLDQVSPGSLLCC